MRLPHDLEEKGIHNLLHPTHPIELGCMGDRSGINFEWASMITFLRSSKWVTSTRVRFCFFLTLFCLPLLSNDYEVKPSY